MRIYSFILVLLCLVLHSCSSFVDVSPYEVAIRETKKLMDKQELDLTFRYVKICRCYSNESGDFFILSSGDLPLQIGSWMPPSIVFPYKDQYICYIDAYSKHVLTKKELQLQLKDENVSDVSRRDDSDLEYIMGVSKDGKSYSLVRINKNIRRMYCPYLYPSLRNYLFSNSPNENPLFVLSDYSVFVDEHYKPENSLKDHIEGLFACEVFVSEVCDSFLIKQVLPPSKAQFVTLNGENTLRYVVEDFIDNHLCLKTEENSSFFQRLPAVNTAHYLDSLIHHHTYCVVERDGRSEYIPVAYFEGSYAHMVRNDSGIVMTIVKDELNDWFKEFGPETKWNNP